MRLSPSLVISTLCWNVQLAGAASAQVFTYDPQSPPRSDGKPRTLSPVEARLVLAQRAGVEQYHSSDLADASVIRSINEFGAQTPLFADRKSEVKKAFILFEGSADSDATLPSMDSFPTFHLSPSPDSSASQSLFLDLAQQSNPQAHLTTTHSSLHSLLSKPFTSSSHSLSTFHITSSKEFTTLFNRLAKSNEWSITALLSPASLSTSSSPSTFSWGDYHMPSSRMPNPKRQLPASPEPFSTPLFTATADEDDNNNSTQPSTSPLRGILPACFATQADCEATTRSCTGHGACSLKFRDPDLNTECYACACTATKSADGLRTTVWAGPACQKQDISVQFWLIALFTVGLVFLISFAVGSVWEMGSEPLPSVIGAGVSGPSAKK